MNEILTAVVAFLNSILPNVLVFIALCFLDVGLGIAAALKRKQFEWAKVADFYKTNVLSLFLGWFLFASFGAFVADKLFFLGEWQQYADDVFIWATWLFVVAKMFSSISGNFKELYGFELMRSQRQEGL